MTDPSRAMASLAAEIARITRLLAPDGPDGGGSAPAEPDEGAPLAILAATFGLSDFERDVVLLCAGVELDGECAAAAARLQDGAPPSFGLALARLSGAHWSALLPTGPLRAWRLIEVGGGTSLVGSPLRIDERVLHFLTGLSFLDERLRGIAEPVAPGGDETSSHQALAAEIAAAMAAGRESPPAVQLNGQDPAARRQVAAHAAAQCGAALLAVDAHVMPEDADALDRVQRLIDREYLLSGVFVLLAVDDPPGADPALDRRIRKFVDGGVAPLILSSPERRPLGARPMIAFEVAPEPAEPRITLKGSSAPPDTRAFYGKYRGKVVENIDPLFLGRIMTHVPAVQGSLTNWAMPCTPYAGPNVGFYAIPPIGANVWVEFEGGDPNYPIWSGCFWDETQILHVPEPPPPEIKVFKTEFVTMVMSDLPEVGGFSLRCEQPAVDVPLTMTFDSTGITLLCPEATIKMTPEGIALTVPEAALAMTAENITATVPASAMTMQAEAIALTCSASSIELSAETIAVEAPIVEIAAVSNFGGDVNVEGATGMVGPVAIEGVTNIVGAVAIEGAVDIAGGLAIEGGGTIDGVPIS